MKIFIQRNEVGNIPIIKRILALRKDGVIRIELHHEVGGFFNLMFGSSTSWHEDDKMGSYQFAFGYVCIHKKTGEILSERFYNFLNSKDKKQYKSHSLEIQFSPEDEVEDKILRGVSKYTSHSCTTDILFIHRDLVYFDKDEDGVTIIDDAVWEEE